DWSSDVCSSDLLTLSDIVSHASSRAVLLGESGCLGLARPHFQQTGNLLGRPAAMTAVLIKMCAVSTALHHPRWTRVALVRKSVISASLHCHAGQARLLEKSP